MKLVINGAPQAPDRQRHRSKRALTMPATSLQAASEEVVKRDPGLTRARRSSRTSLIPSASLVI